jgi:threonyl-tRNA synthetase
MVNITLPDGSVKSYEDKVTALQVATEISEGLARNVLAAEVNGEIWDATREIASDASLKLLTFDADGGKSTMWHSSAHLLAEALESLFTGVKIAICPPIENGFYYDVDFMGQEFTDKDFKRVEEKMIELARLKNPFERIEISKADAIKYFQEKDDPYKLELLEGLEDGQITFYKQGGFTDLCRGPHIPHTGFIKAAKVMSIAGAYWRGDEKNKQECTE